MNRLNQVNFGFNDTELARFKEIFEETTKVYPELVADDVSIQRVRVLIAHSILTNDAPLKPNKKDEENDIILDLDKNIKIEE